MKSFNQNKAAASETGAQSQVGGLEQSAQNRQTRMKLRGIPRALDMFFAAVMGTSICFVIHPQLQGGANLLAEATGGLPMPVIWMVFISLSTAFWSALHFAGVYRLRDFYCSEATKHVPVWMAGLLGTLLYFLLTQMSELHGSELPDLPTLLLGVTCIFAGAVLAGLYPMLRPSATTQTPSAKPDKKNYEYASMSPRKRLQQLLQDDAKFARWLAQEGPISYPSEDYFDIVPMAQRIARRLTQHECRSIALIGRFGCGKSSLINLVEYYVDGAGHDNGLQHGQQGNAPFGQYADASKLVHCRVGGWGVERFSATQLILEKVVDQLAQRMDVLAIRGVPDNYRKAMGHAKLGGVSSLLSVCERSKRPEQVLESIDEILTRTGLRVVVYLEDMDRNGNDPAFWCQIEALLDRLHNLHNISFVLAFGSRPGVEDSIFRLCDYTELFHEVDSEAILCILEDFVIKNKPDFFNAAETGGLGGVEKTRLGTWRRNELWRTMVSPEVQEPLDHIVTLLDTPRKFKSFLRRVKSQWKRLAGEVDFDDLIALNVLRIGAREAYTFVCRNLQDLRACKMFSSSRSSREKEKWDKLQENWEKITTGVEWDSSAARALVEVLFPRFSKRGATSQVDLASQRVCLQGYPDYFDRIVAEALRPEEIKDQAVIRALQYFSEKPDSIAFKTHTLPDAIYEEPGFAEKVERFGSILSAEGVKELATQMFAKIISDPAASKGVHKPAPGFIEIWRTALNKQWNQEEYNKWIISEIEKALAKNLQFANTVYYYWRTYERGPRRSEQPTEKVRNAAIAKLKELVKDNPGKLLEILGERHHNEWAWSIYHFAVFFSKPNGGGNGFNPGEWRWLANCLLEAGHKKPKIIVPQFATLLFNRDRQMGVVENMGFESHWVYEFDESTFDGLFPSEVKQQEVCNLLVHHIVFEDYEQDVQGYLVHAQEWAKERIEPEHSISE